MAEDTADELVGYITGNARRKQIIDVLVKGDEHLIALAKLTRIPRLSLEKAIGEMVDKKIVSKEKTGYHLTETGKQVVALTKSI